MNVFIAIELNTREKGGNKQWDIGAAHPALLSILKHTDKDSSPLIPNGTAFVPGTNNSVFTE
jgi:hypothetical protein